MSTTNADNLAVEPPIYVENFSRTREHTYRALAADGLHRLPVHPTEEVWNQYQQIPLIPNPALVANAGPIGIVPVELIQMQLRPVAGSTLKWEQAPVQPLPLPPPPAGAPGSLVRVIPATFGNKDGVPGAYQPSLVGGPAYDGHTWVVDGLNRYVEFPYGSPTGATTLTLLFYRYTGLTGGGTIGPAGTHVWHYIADATTPNLTLCPDPAFPGAALSHFVAPLTAQSTEGAGSRIMFDVDTSSIRAGLVTGTQWDLANRGVQSVAFGQNTVAAGAQSVVSGGLLNVVDAASNGGTIGGGQSCSLTASAFGTVCGGILNTINNGNFSYIGGGTTNRVLNGQRHAIVCGDGNTIDSVNGTGDFIGAGSTNLITELLGNPSAQCFIGAGNNGTISGGFGCAIVAGQANQVQSSTFAFIGAGQTNTASGSSSAIVAGDTNVTTAGLSFRCFIGAGRSNTTVQSDSGIVAGATNTTQGAFCFIGAGNANLIQGGFASGCAIAAGTENTIGAPGNTAYRECFIGAGRLNVVTGDFASVVGGGAPVSVVGGAVGNTASGYGSFIGGGGYETSGQATDRGHVAAGKFSTIAGGGVGAAKPGNPVVGHSAQGDYSTIGGGGGSDGAGDFHQTVGVASFIGGGRANRILVDWSTVCGGQNNRIGGAVSIPASDSHFIGGGSGNYIETNLGAGGSNALSVICGGGANNISRSCNRGFIGGGTNNGIDFGAGGPATDPAEWCVVGGGQANLIRGCSNSVITGGQGNAISGVAPQTDNFIGGGSNNSMGSCLQSVICGGVQNLIPNGSIHAFMGGGRENIIKSALQAVVLCGGFQNQVDSNSTDGSSFAFLGGGQLNTISVASYVGTGLLGPPVLCGGQSNSVTAGESFIGGGSQNATICKAPFINPSDSTQCIRDVICGGSSNLIINNHGSAIVGGIGNRISHDPAVTTFGDHTGNFIGGGITNVIDQVGAATSPGCVANAICGGAGNQILDKVAFGGPFALHNFIGGGRANAVAQKHSVVCGGEQNLAEGLGCVVVGGSHQGDGGDPPGTWNNQATGDNAFVGCGHFNLSIGTYTFVGNGERNTASSTGSFVGSGIALAGIGNNVASGLNSAIVTGDRNLASGNGAFVGSGHRNRAVGLSAVVCGGENFSGGVYSINNQATGNSSFIGGGTANVAAVANSAVVGGQANTAGNSIIPTSHDFVGGGRNNSAQGGFSGVLGGDGNAALAAGSAILGGVGNSVPAGCDRSSILGGTGIIATAAQTDTAYAQRLATRGGRQKRVTKFAANGTLALDDHVAIFSNGTGAIMTLNLPAAPVDGQEYWVKVTAVFAGGANSNVLSGNGNSIINNFGVASPTVDLSGTLGVTVHVVWAAVDAVWLQLH